MKNKKIYIFIISISVLLCILMAIIVFVNLGKRKDFSTYMNDTWVKEGTLISELKTDQFNKSLSDLSTYKYNKFISSTHTQNFYREKNKEISSKISSLYLFNKSFPVEHVQVIDKDHICVVYRLDRDGSCVYAYVIFTRELQYFEVSKKIKEAGTYESWNNYGEYYLVGEALNSEDYLHIQKGDKLLNDDAKKLAITLENGSKFLLKTDDGNVQNSVMLREFACLLKDGVLVVSIEKTISDEDILSNYIVNKTEFYPYKTTENIPYDFSVLTNAFVPVLP